MAYMNYLNGKIASFFLGFFVILFSSIAALYFVHYQLGGYDLSPLIDLHWRLSNKEVPGKDFINTWPYAVVIAVKLVSWGTLLWRDLTVINVLAASVIYLLIASCARNNFPKNWYLLTAISISLPLVHTNHLWHSSISQYLAMFYFLATYQVLKNKNVEFTDCVFICISSGLLITAKQNIAAPMLLFTLLYFTMVRDYRKVVPFILLGTLSGLILTGVFLSQSIDSFIYLYTSVLGRAKTELGMYYELAMVKTHWFAIPLMIIVFFSFYRSTKILILYERAYLYLVSFVCLIPILTDWDTKWNNLSFPIFVAIVSAYSYSSGSFKIFKRDFLSLSIILLYLVAIYGGVTRERMKAVGPFFQEPANVKLKEGYFKGMYVGEELNLVLQEIHHVRDRWPSKKIYFGPRIEFAYLDTQSISPKHFPLYFFPGTSYAKQDNERVANAFKNANFGVLVFRKNDRTRIPAEITDFIDRNYNLSDQYESLDVYIQQ